MLTRARVAVLGLVGLSLAACGNVHPGDAAVVDGRSISMESLDRTAEAYCTLTVGAGAAQGAPAVSNSDVRRQAVTALVSIVVARKLSKSEAVVVNPASYELTTAQQDQIAKAFPKENLARLGRAIEESQEVAAIAVALAEKSTGEKRTAANETQLAQTGQAQILKAFKANDVRFAPRFGLSQSARPSAGSGSLSAASSTTNVPTGDALPVAQRCS
ncbi:hypothetical protein [Aeromicrobium sp.]|uniref:hypothetical protein n=1 Tax=Aeromicrobium sp. TaxID=1871063 RepID=UPI001991A76E|nr:hypothetical protein [Aeromicrobium sp.]MBC7631230.1 hypothetical protein [Aeromicrobium sp.]